MSMQLLDIMQLNQQPTGVLIMGSVIRMET